MGATPTEDAVAETTAAAEVNFDEVDAAVSAAVQHAWVEFARTGVPRYLDDTAWPTCDPTDPRYTLISDTLKSRPLDVSPLTEMISTQRDSA